MKDDKGRITTTVKEYDALSTEHMIECQCCHVIRVCKLYTLQNGEAAWVCVGCRNGTSEAFAKPPPKPASGGLSSASIVRKR